MTTHSAIQEGIQNGFNIMKRRSTLPFGFKFSLFASSYLPLFLLIVVRQIVTHWDDLSWGGLSLEAVLIFFRYFWFSIVVGAIGVYGIVGTVLSLKSVSRTAASNGTLIEVSDVRNKNSEALGYLATYIIPFLFEDVGKPYEFIAISLLLTVAYIIYVNSSLVLINPVLTLRYSLYEIDFIDNPGLSTSGTSTRKRSGLIITQDRYLREGDRLLLKNLGHKLYLAAHDPKSNREAD